MRFLIIMAKLAAIHLAIIALRLRYRWVCWRGRRLRRALAADRPAKKLFR